MSIEISKTNRGFVVGKFNDAYGANCSIQESSNVEPHLWLGSDDLQERHHVTGEILSARMHLNREQVAELLPLMHYFVANGHLPRANAALNAACEAADALSTPPAAVAVPEGMVLVPVEPTIAMESAGADALEDKNAATSLCADARNAYLAMLAAAPASPAATGLEN